MPFQPPVGHIQFQYHAIPTSSFPSLDTFCKMEKLEVENWRAPSIHPHCITKLPTCQWWTHFLGRAAGSYSRRHHNQKWAAWPRVPWQQTCSLTVLSLWVCGASKLHPQCGHSHPKVWRVSPGRTEEEDMESFYCITTCSMNILWYSEFASLCVGYHCLVPILLPEMVCRIWESDSKVVSFLSYSLQMTRAVEEVWEQGWLVCSSGPMLW